MRQRISVGALILDAQDRIALVRHVKPGVYDFLVAPGGGLERGESLEEGARREAIEEAGIDPGPMRLIAIEQMWAPIAQVQHVKLWHFARLDRTGPPLAADDASREREGIVEARWFARRELEGRIYYPSILEGAFWDTVERGFAEPLIMAPADMTFE